MTDSQLNEIFKKQLPAHESPVPEDMWERIIRRKDRDRRGFFFFFTLIGLFILGFVTAGILLFNVNRKEVSRVKQTFSDSNIVSSSNNAQSVATDPVPKKDSSLNNDAVHGRNSSLHMVDMHKDHVKDTIPSEERHAAFLQLQETAKNKSVENDQMKSNADSVSDLSGNADSKNSSKTSEDSSKLSDQKANLAIASTPRVLTSDSAKNTTLKKQDTTKKIAGKKWSLDLYASPDYPIEYAKYYVKSKLSYSVGLRLNRSFGKRFSGKIGIQFSQLNYALPDTSGYSNDYHLLRLDLPVLAGYSWGNETFGMTVNAGAIFNIYSWLHPSANYIKSNAGLSLYLGFNFSKHINDRMEIFSEPYYRYQLSTSTVSTFYFQKFIDVAGISFGARYHFRR